MENLFQTLDNYLSQVPWWLTVLVTVIIFAIINKKLSVSVDARLTPGRDFKEKMRDLAKPMQTNSSFTKSMRVVTNSSTLAQHSNPDVQSSEFTFEGDDAQKLYALLQSGDKIGAIKFVREKKKMDLVDAKNLVEAISKLT